MYGPPPHPDQVLVASGITEQPLAWAIALGVGALAIALAIGLRRRPAVAVALAALGEVSLLTAPFLGLLPGTVYGAYPTIDKQGSILFYLDGVHRRMLAAPFEVQTDPAAQLIGIHTGHLWVSEFFDLFLTSYAAFNAQGLLYLVLAIWCTWWFLATLSGDKRAAFALAAAYGLSLHVFRDLNWYTIEKAAVFTLPLYAGCWIRTLRDGGRWAVAGAAVVLVTALLNLYMALVLGLAAGLGTLIAAAGMLRAGNASGLARLRPLLASYGLTVVLIAPLIAAQALLLRGGSSLATPDCFLATRAALDTLTIWPPAWNRLEIWRAVEPISAVVALWALLRLRRSPLTWAVVGLGLAFASLALGPYVVGVANPVYFAAWYGIPYFWRIAKPEVFFFVSSLCILGLASLGLASLDLRTRTLAALHAAMLLMWIPLVRLHPVYPEFTEYAEATLAPTWTRRLDRTRRCEVDPPSQSR